ncbi:hypothetical protein EDD11_008949 [Mortierella claussenii]|nr:hypothetical protein EDD11_008949 [Mortierella claussenii]
MNERKARNRAQEAMVHERQSGDTSQGDNSDEEFKARRAEKYGSDPISFDCVCDPSQGTVILFYAYLPIDDPLALAKHHKTWSADLELCGKVKVATEGINATLSGSSGSIATYIDKLTSLPEFASLGLAKHSTNESDTDGGSNVDRRALERRRYTFFKPTPGCRHVFDAVMSIKVVEEICPLGAPELNVYHDPENKRGKLPPNEFHQKLKELGRKEDVVVLDVRNYYESSIGRFPGAITPPIRKFSSFRDYVERNKDKLSGKTILSYCTGGIRCEKATSYMRQTLGKEGDIQPAQVMMLEGGIHNYLEWVKQEGLEKDSLWLGKNYVFDARQSLGLEDAPTTDIMGEGDRLISSCQGCGSSCARYVKCDGTAQQFRSPSAATTLIAHGMSSNAAESQWLFRKEDLYRTPSLMSGLSYSLEKDSRRRGVTFIIQVGMHLKLPQLTLATAALFFHRFYMRHSLKDYKFYDIGATCIYLASKTEESTRKFKDVIIACAQKAAKKDIQIDDSSKEFRVWKETIIYTEEILLEALCFELSVEHPYQYMLSLLGNHYTKDDHRMFALDISQDAVEGLVLTETALCARKLKSVAWAFINDSLRTTLCLLYPPKTIALAAIHMAAKYMDENLNESLGEIWRELFEPDVQDITDLSGLPMLDAANEIMDLYTQFPTQGGRSLDKMLPGSKPGSEYQENGTPSYGGYLNSPAKLATPVYNIEPGAGAP